MLEPGLRPEPAWRGDQHLPNLAYFGRAFKRQLPLALVIAALAAPIAIGISWQQKDRLSSYAAAVYDDRDSAEAVPRYPLYPRFPQVADAFKTRLADPEFLWQVASEVGLNSKEAKPLSPLKLWLQRHLPGGRRLFPEGQDSEAQDDAKVKEANADYLKRAFASDYDDKKNIVSLRVTTDDALLSKQLADAAMELFIQGELRFEAESFRRQHEVFAGYLRTQKLAADAEHPSEHKKDEPHPAPQAAQERLREREAELQDKIQSLRAEGDQEKSRLAAQRAALEADLARLTTKLQPSHPDVIAKRDELRQLGRDSGDSGRPGRINQLRSQLAELREQEEKLGMVVASTEVRGEDAGPQRGQFIASLADRVKELSLEEIRMMRQVDAPALRTRLRLFVPATYDTTPPGKAKRRLLRVLLSLGLLGGVVAAVLRELSSPYARDAWRVAWHSRLQVLAELNNRSLRAYRLVSPQQATALREAARRSDKRSSQASAALQAYRRLEFQLRQTSQGQIVLLQSAAEGGRTSDFCYNFLNIVGSETPGSVLLIDCDSRDPVVGSDEMPQQTHILADFLAGKATWRQIRLARTSERAFDLVPAPSAMAPEMAFTSSSLQALFANLTKHYSRIFVRAYDIRQMLETEPFLQVVTDCVLLVDANAATFAELDRAVQLTPSGKTRGLVMIGT